MIARSALPFTLRSIIDRFGLGAATQCRGRGSSWQRMIVAFEEWWIKSYFAWRRFRRPSTRSGSADFAADCSEDTPHEGFDEFGVGWYAQIYHCRYCGEQGMRIWPLA